METFFIILGSAVIVFFLIKLLPKGALNFILPQHFHVRHEIFIRDRQFDDVLQLLREHMVRNDLFENNDPYDLEQAKRKIENYTVESFRSYVDKNCLTDRIHFIENELEHNQIRLNTAKEKGWGFSTQVRQHCIKIIKQVLKQTNQGT